MTEIKARPGAVSRSPSIFDADKIISALTGQPFARPHGSNASVTDTLQHAFRHDTQPHFVAERPQLWVVQQTMVQQPQTLLFQQPVFQSAPQQSMFQQPVFQSAPQQSMFQQPVFQIVHQPVFQQSTGQQPVFHSGSPVLQQSVERQCAPVMNSWQTSTAPPLLGGAYRAMRRHHVFIDYSNLLISARHSSGTYDKRVELNCRAIVNLIESGRSCIQTRFIAGSSEDSDWTKVWERYGFKACHNKRSADRKEVGVDDLIIGTAQGLLVDEMEQTKRQTMVLVTGDGNDNGGRDSFVSLARRVLRVGWKLEIWAWKKSCSQAYVKMAAENRNVRLVFFDEWAHRVLVVPMADGM